MLNHSGSAEELPSGEGALGRVVSGGLRVRKRSFFYRFDHTSFKYSNYSGIH